MSMEFGIEHKGLAFFHPLAGKGRFGCAGLVAYLMQVSHGEVHLEKMRRGCATAVRDPVEGNEGAERKNATEFIAHPLAQRTLAGRDTRP